LRNLSRLLPRFVIALQGLLNRVQEILIPMFSSGPSDSWLTPDGAYLYQIYGNASKLVGYATRPDGSLEEVTRVTIPYNSPQGLAGF
jgi:hypothetical protein